MVKFSNLVCFITVFTIAQFGYGQQVPIGVFDSGTGGLTVLEAMLSLDAFNNKTGVQKPDGIPDFAGEYFHYLADQANMPYGNYASENKTLFLKEQILRCMSFLSTDTTYAKRTKDTFQFFPKLTAKMIVVACNTATAYALPEIKKFVGTDLPVVGVIDAGCKAALNYQQQQRGTVGVFATVGTVASDGYPKTLERMALAAGITNLSIVSQGGYGLAESIDRDWSFLADQVNKVRAEYKGPSLSNEKYRIDTALYKVYGFLRTENSLLCEYDQNGNCTEMQLNDPVNYVRYHLVSLLEKMNREQYQEPLNTLILGCTHYPYMRDTISRVLQELYNYQVNGAYRYRKVLSEKVCLIDPAIETAKEAYIALRQLSTIQKRSFLAKKENGNDAFFIAIPNLDLPEIETQPDGWFTYRYKYGRQEGSGKDFVRFVPFDTKNIAQETYDRFKRALPYSYDRITKAGVLSPSH
ncbi:MAG: Asp/Glu/hydantoin racemase [Bacteroidetes bacterium]|nr:Asp/Glu/hydantoin racemase [Bacteroidota bacterium]